MGLSMITLTEIYTNPRDLGFSVNQENGKFAAFIRRGPGHRFKLLMSSEHRFATADMAIAAIEETLDLVLKKGKEIFRTGDQDLTQVLIDKIVEDLTKYRGASTYEPAKTPS